MNTTTPVTENTQQPKSALGELRAWLDESAARCRAMQWFGALFRFGVAQDIARDVDAAQTSAREAVSASEKFDHDAERDLVQARIELETALKGGLDNSDVGKVQAAIARLKAAQKNVRASAARDHSAVQILSPA